MQSEEDGQEIKGERPAPLKWLVCEQSGIIILFATALIIWLSFTLSQGRLKTSVSQAFSSFVDYLEQVTGTGNH